MDKNGWEEENIIIRESVTEGVRSCRLVGFGLLYLALRYKASTAGGRRAAQSTVFLVTARTAISAGWFPP